MDEEQQRPRVESAISDDESEQSRAPSAPVDFERLFAELDTSTSASFSATDEGGHAVAPPAEERSRDGAQPAQPAFDFGEPDYAAPFAAQTAHDTSIQIPDDGGEVMSRKVLMVAGALGALGVLIGGIGLLVAFNASHQAESLQQSVDALEARIATLQISGDPRVGQLQAEQAGMASRLEEIAMRLEGMSAGSAQDDELARLQKKVEALEIKTRQPAQKVAAVTTTPQKSTTPKPAPARGDWTVILLSFPTSAQAESEKSRLQKVGIRAEVSKSQVDGKPWYRLRVPGYTSQELAKAAIPSIESKSGIKGAWVAHR